MFQPNPQLAQILLEKHSLSTNNDHGCKLRYDEETRHYDIRFVCKKRFINCCVTVDAEAGRKNCCQGNTVQHHLDGSQQMGAPFSSNAVRALVKHKEQK